MRHIPPIATDLAVPRWRAAGFAKSVLGSSSFRSQNAKPLKTPLAAKTYMEK